MRMGILKRIFAMYRKFLFSAIVLILTLNCSWADKPEYVSNGKRYMTERMLIMKSDKKILREHKFQEWEQEKREIIPVIINLNICSEDEGADIPAEMVLEERIIVQQDRILDKLLKNKKVRIRYIFQLIPSISCEIPANLLNSLSINPIIDSVEPIEKGKLLTKQGIPQIGGDVYRSQYTGNGISIAIVDNGIEADHPYLGDGEFGVLTAKIKGGRSFVPGDGSYVTPSDTHGTACAGIAAGGLDYKELNDDYIGGVAYNSHLYSLKILEGKNDIESDVVCSAIEWCTLQKEYVDSSLLVISMSFGVNGFLSPYDGYCDNKYTSLYNAVNVAKGKGITLVAASGNDGDTNGMNSPACLSNVISVGAVYDNSIPNYKYIDNNTVICGPEQGEPDKVACFSNSSWSLDLLAPSYQAATTIIGGSIYDGFSGTSAACPYVAGAVAVIQEAADDILGHYLTPDEIREKLTSTGDNIADHRAGANNRVTPRINIAKAIQSMMHKVTVSSDSNGSIDPIGEVYVKPGGSLVFNATPSAGYVVDVWKKKGVVVQSGGTYYPLTNVTAPCTLEVTFKYPASQGTTVPLTATEYANIYSNSPTVNNTYANVMQIYYQGPPYNYWAGLLKFNLNGIPAGSTINSARLELNCLRDDGNNNIGLLKCISGWTQSTVCWNNVPDTGGVTFNSDSSGVGTWIWVNPYLDQYVQSWIDDPSMNYGLFLGANTYGFAEFSNGSSGVSYVKRPKLVVDYSGPPPADLIVRDLDPTPTPDGGVYYVGDTINWEVDVKNNSTHGYADETKASFHIVSSLSETLNATNFIDDQIIEPLEPGKSDSGSVSYPFEDSDVGTRYVIAKADYYDVVDELDEGNNTRVYGPFTVSRRGSLFVLLEPKEIHDSDAKWSIDGTHWYDSGHTLTNIPAGTYMLSYQTVADWNAPASLPVHINNNTTKSLSRVYTKRYDIDRNNIVDLSDLSLLADRWQDVSCGEAYWCNEADIDRSGVVDFNDLAILADNWLDAYRWDSTWLENMNFEFGDLTHWRVSECGFFLDSIMIENAPLSTEGEYSARADLQATYAGEEAFYLEGCINLYRHFDLPWTGDWQVSFDAQLLCDDYPMPDRSLMDVVLNRTWLDTIPDETPYYILPNKRYTFSGQLTATSSLDMSINMRTPWYSQWENRISLLIDNCRIIPVESN